MVQGMSRDAWDEFSKTILVRYVLSYLCGTLYLDPSVSLERMFEFSAGGLFSLSVDAAVSRASNFALTTVFVNYFNLFFRRRFSGPKR